MNPVTHRQLLSSGCQNAEQSDYLKQLTKWCCQSLLREFRKAEPCSQICGNSCASGRCLWNYPRIATWPRSCKSRPGARAEDTYQRAFLPRFIASCPRDAWKLCAEIEKHLPPIKIIRLFYYWLTARAEPILYRYVTEELFQVARAGTVDVRVDDLYQLDSERVPKCRKEVF